jgi:hypothetical protein
MPNTRVSMCERGSMQCRALHQAAVPAVLPSQRGAAAGLTRPLVAVLAVCLDDHGVLPLAEGLLLNLRVELVAPPAGERQARGARQKGPGSRVRHRQSNSWHHRHNLRWWQSGRVLKTFDTRYVAMPQRVPPPARWVLLPRRSRNSAPRT